MALLATKLLLAPLCVVGVSLAGRRWGMAVAGILGGLPVVAGPILLVLTLTHGSSFGADAAEGALLGLFALTMFVVTYGRLAPRASPTATVTVGWLAFLVGVGLLTLVDAPPLVALILVGAGFALGLRLLAPRRSLATPPPLPWWDLPARALSALVLVVVITAVSDALGPHLSGLLAPFPIVTSVLAVFTHAHGDPDQVRILLRSFLVGFYGFASFCFALTITLDSLAVAAAFGVAVLAALAVQAVTFTVQTRTESSTPSAIGTARD